MRLSSIFSAACLGLLLADALPYQLNALNSREEIQHLDPRAPHQKPVAPEKLAIGSETSLNVPMQYAAWMDTVTGNYERYQADSGPNTYLLSGNIADVAERQMATNQLILCMDVNLVSPTGAIKVHIAPSVCTELKGYKGDKPSALGGNNDYKAAKAALRKLIKKHGKAMGPWKTFVVYGPENRFTEEDTRLVLADLFGIGTKFQRFRELVGIRTKASYPKQTFKAPGPPVAPGPVDPNAPAAGSTTRLRLNPVQLFLDEVDQHITLSTTGTPVTGSPGSGSLGSGSQVGGSQVGGSQVGGSQVGDSPVSGAPVRGGSVSGGLVKGSPVSGGPVRGVPVVGGPAGGSVVDQ